MKQNKEGREWPKMLCDGQRRLVCDSDSLTQTWMTEGKSHINVYEKRFQASETSETASQSPWVGMCIIIQKSRQEGYVAEMDYREE